MDNSVGRPAVIRREVTDQIRRVLLFALGPQAPRGADRQLELNLWPEEKSGPEPILETELSDQAHALLLELTVLIQMETSGLVATPLKVGGRQRIGLGSEPPLRLLAEWEHTRPAEESPWQLGLPGAGREEAYSAGLGRVRALADAIGLTPTLLRETVRRLYLLAGRLDPADDLPGQIYGHSLKHVLRRTPAGRLGFQAERLRGRGLGGIQTPPELAAEMLDIVLAAVEPSDGRQEPKGGSDGNGSGEAGGTHADGPRGGGDRTDGGEGTDGTTALEVLDPACGSGQFLLAAARKLIGEPPHRAGEDPAACARRLSGLLHLCGVDLDPRAARIAAWNLCHWAAVQAGAVVRGRRGAAGEVGPFLDSVFGAPFPWFLGTQIQVGNALQIEPSPFSPGFLWEKRYARVFDRQRPGFDLVVGNPPWVSHGLRDRAPGPEEERRYFERLFPAGTQYKLTPYPLFIELALRLCRTGGCHAFLVPDSLLTGHHFSRIRRLLLSSADLLELTLVEAGTWPGVHVGHTVLYAVRKKGSCLPAPISVRNRILHPETRRGTESVWVPSIQYSPTGSAPLRIYRDEQEMEFLARMQASPLRVRDVAWMYSGLIARYGQRSIQTASPRPRFDLRDGRGTTVYQDADARGAWRPALLSGGEIVPFGVRWSGGYVYMPPERENLARVYKSGFDLSRYQGPKLFLRQTGDSLIAAVDAEGLFCLNNLHLVGAGESAGIPPLLLAAVLMSGPVQRFYRISTLESARPLAQVDLKSVEALPYPADRAGAPVGSVPPPLRSIPQARRVLRTVDRALETESTRDLLELTDAAWHAAADRYGGGPLNGREILSLLLVRLGEILEAEARAPVGSEASRRRRAVGRRGGARRSAPGAPTLAGISPPSGANGRRPRSASAGPSAGACLLDEVVGVLFRLGTPQSV